MGFNMGQYTIQFSNNHSPLERFVSLSIAFRGWVDVKRTVNILVYRRVARNVWKEILILQH